MASLRVEIPRWSESYKWGDRTGEVVAEKTGKTGMNAGRTIWVVLLDKSNTYRTYAADDCRIVAC